MDLTFPPTDRDGVLRSALICGVLVGFSIAFADRPLATWSHAHLHGMFLFVWMTRIVEPVPDLALAGLAGYAIARLAGWRPGPVGQTLLAFCLATLLALALKDRIKYLCGRTWPETWTGANPSWIADGIFAWEPFHPGEGWRSFPSGHTTLIAAPMSVLWCRLRLHRARWLVPVPVILVAAGLIGADYHWLSDVIAGAFLGTAAGLGTIALLRGPFNADGA